MKIAWLEVTEDKKVSPAVKAVYKRVEAEWGKNLNIYRTTAIWPELLELKQKLHKLLIDDGELSSEIKELSGVVVAYLNRSIYWEKHFRERLVKRGWTEEKITHILQDVYSQHLTPTDREILKFTYDLTENPKEMSLEKINKLREVGLTERQIFEAAQTASYLNEITRVANALGIQAD